MNEYIIHLREFFGNSELEIESPVDDHEFKLVAMNIKLSESQAKRLVKSIVEICENVLLAEREELILSEDL